ncbi:MAG: hypothetical protein PUP46_08150 [Endozoicomonas sp. (ex Botrylloides leachii)]|nr:hypothetical protein [Endozoicomonas sp. (ex Botrylloides leachii)]
MYQQVKKSILFFGTSLLLATTVHADQSAISYTTPTSDPVIAVQKKHVPMVNTSWSQIAVARFYPAQAKITFILDSPAPYKVIKFKMDKSLQLESAQVYDQNNNYFKLAYQAPSASEESVEKDIPPSFGSITKVVVTYKNPENSQGTIHLLGRNSVNHYSST